MKIFQQSLEDITVTYPIELLGDPEKILFLDIETTGFSPKLSKLYLIGCACYVEGHWSMVQWIAENYAEEKDILIAFFEFSKPFQTLIHFNGNSFDLPFLLHKSNSFDLPYTFDGYDGTDIYKRTAPYKYFLKLANCRQKTLEQFLNIDREDVYNGGELIEMYHEYVRNASSFVLQTLLLHNADDMRGMLRLLPVLAYSDLFNRPVRAKRVQANYYKGLDGLTHPELLMKIELPVPLPVPVSFGANGCYFSGFESEGSLKVPICKEEMKYFYANYKDYYYLPDEDAAMHRSVACFVDKEYRIPATAATCYTRKYSVYLPQWSYSFEPFFKRDYKSKDIFFELTDELKSDRAAFGTYAAHVLEMLSMEH